MGAGGSAFRRAIKLASLIEMMPTTDGKDYQQCSREQKCRMMLELAFKEMTGTTYQHQWFVENKQYL